MGRRGVPGTVAGTATAREAAGGRKGTTLTGGARRSAVVREGEGGEVGHGGRWARLGRGGKEKRKEREKRGGLHKIDGLAAWCGVGWAGKEKRADFG
jgi:hypothetical protein